MANITDQLFSSLCRTCMHELNEPLFEANTGPEQKWQSVFDTIQECGALQIAELLSNIIPQILEVQLNDELPKKICCECLQQLQNAYRFQRICVQSDQQMRELISKRYPNAKHTGPTVLDFVLDTEEHRIDFKCVNTLPVEPQLSIADPLKSTSDTKDHSADFPLDVGGFVKTEIGTDDSYAEFSDEEILLPTVTVKTEETSKEAEMEQVSLGEPNKLKTDKQEIPLHLKKKTDNYRFKCELCQRCFQKPESLHKHRLIHNSKAGKKKRSHVCDLCEKTYNSPVTLANHKRLRHSADQTQNSLKHYACEFCDRIYKSSVSLKHHVRTHTGERVLCPECGKSFSTEGNLKQHRLRHRDDKPYECPYCPLRFTCVSSVYNHKKIHEAKTNICDICGAAFSQPYELKKHKRYHLGERKYKCDYCDMRFVRPDHQRRHMRTHTGEKPYKCKYCDRAYAQSNDHIKHLRTHLGDNVYRCELCPLTFRLASELRAHFASHKNEDEETREQNMKALKEAERLFFSELGCGIGHSGSGGDGVAIGNDSGGGDGVGSGSGSGGSSSGSGGSNGGGFSVGNGDDSGGGDGVCSDRDIVDSGIGYGTISSAGNTRNNKIIEPTKMVTDKLLFDYLCRTCMHELVEMSSCDTITPEQQWQSLLDVIEECDSLSITQLLCNTIPQIEVQLNDELPKKICCECLQKLKSAYRFQQICKQSQQHMYELVAERKTNLKILIEPPAENEKLDNEEILVQAYLLDSKEFESVKTLPKTPATSADDPLESNGTAIKTENYESNVEYSDSDELLVPRVANNNSLTVIEKEKTNSSPPYICSICNKNFSKSRYLKCHLIRHKKKDEKSKSIKTYTNAEFENYESNVEYSDSDELLVPSVVNNNSLHVIETEKTNSSPPYICAICNKNFSKSRYLKCHLIRHKKKDEKRLLTQTWRTKQEALQTYQYSSDNPLSKSPIKTFSSVDTDNYENNEACKNDESNVKYTVLNVQEPLLVSKKLELVNILPEEPTTTVDDPPQGNGSAIKSDFSVNAVNHVKAVNNESNVEYSNRGEKLLTPFTAATEKGVSSTSPQLICVLCNKSFSTPRFLKCHLKRHKEGEEQKLQKQKKVKKSKTQIKAFRKYQCKFCDKCYKRSNALRNHTRTHTGERPFLCPECGKSFTASTNLKNHLGRHSVIKAYECPLCPKKFRCSSNLISHKKTHNAVKSHICDVCGYAFRQASLLRKHKLNHSGEKPYKCDFCGMRFVRADQQRRHIRIHTGEKPYKCKYCECAYAQGNDLIKHLRIHIGDNVYRCELCPLAFRLVSELNLHIIKHKNEDPETREQNMIALKEAEVKLQLKLTNSICNICNKTRCV
ncbi:zinc finger protein 91-like [Eurosta solidaginis]|uniref:zinc finger protein 91-like n=1 Tax=Eurosta solidaginis TaxID=178769 RepID=UPI0035312D90